MKRKTIQWGIIGLGSIANKFATDLASVEDSQLVAVASRSQQKADKFAFNYNSKKAYDSYEKLVKDSQVDAVYIATPHRFHKEHTLLCLRHKKAVLCEKPFAMNLQDVTEMVEVAKEHNVLLMEALWTFFLPHFNYVIDVVKSEKFGKLKSLEADFGFFHPYDIEHRLFNKQLGGGSLLDIGIYPIFVALSSLGKPKSIAAAATFFDNGADSSCSLIFDYGITKAYLKSSLLEETPTEAIFTFEEAVVKLNTRFHESPIVTIYKDEKEEMLDFNYKTFGYSFETAHFSQLIREGKKESNIMTFEFSKKLISTMDEVREIISLEYDAS
jgi:predicted dehydrogenase